MERPKNYFITCFEKLPENNHFDTGSSRCFGYYETLEEADLAVKENCCDLHECLYIYCFVEAIEPGIHAICMMEDRHFYEFNLIEQRWEPKDEPACLNHIINFAIG